MANRTRIGALSLALVAITVAAEGKEHARDDRPTVFVHIENRAAVPPETIAAARDELAHIYDDAGVHVESSTDPGHDRCALQLTVHVALLAGTAADRFMETQGVKRTVLAQANRDARRVYVFWDRIGPSVDHAIGRGDALGLVIAHELGHVLLPIRGHSQVGIMQENYHVHGSYASKFTAEQSAAMRAFIEDARVGRD